MWLSFADDAAKYRALRALVEAVDASRFTAQFDAAAAAAKLSRKKSHLKISVIRLRNGKDYCGQHPGPCLVDNRPHRRSRCLEGKDWVGWNDLLNDTLDRLELEADVFSYNLDCRERRYFIRKGRKRRFKFEMTEQFKYGRPLALWCPGDDSCYADCCGVRPVPSEYPDGTPGLVSYRLEDEAALAPS